MVIKRIWIFFLIILLISILIPDLSALQQEINIKTLSNHSISVVVRESGNNLNRLEGFHKNSGNGNLTLSGSYSVDNIDLVLTLFRNGKNILNEKFENLKTGEPIFINFIPGEVGFIDIVEETPSVPAEINIIENKTLNESVNKIIEETKATKEEVKEESSSITGFSIKNLTVSNNTKNLIIYVVIGIILAGGIVFFIYHRKKIPKEIKVIKYSSMKLDSEEKKGLMHAEEKLRAAQDEIEKIKNKQNAIFEAEKRLEADRRALEKLKRGF